MQHWLFIAPLTLLWLTTGCVNDDLEEAKKEENKIIGEYLTANGIAEDTKTEGGIYFIEDVVGTGISPLTDNYVFINYTGRYLETNEIRETNNEQLKDEWPAAQTFTNLLYGPTKLLFGYSIPGFNEGLSLMKEGGKARLIIPSNKAYYDETPLIYEIELIKVVKNPVAYEDSVVTEYLNANGFTTDNRIDTLVWFKETLTPDLADTVTVEPGDTVFIRFEGRLVDGFSNPVDDSRVFDSNGSEPLKYVYGTSKVVSGSILQIPAGFNVALDSMRNGTHATVVIPYTQAFGEDGLVNSIHNYVMIPPYQTLVYDIVVEEIRHPAGK
ncbi:MAG: FKBP-type peptidyl-prolyl cis-trans isomerase [Bacteroidales bacterium]|nr:FKBP-type peptidyl-prolyl cis-trans isomerase [Bacteroidales bacterium]